MVSHKRWGLLSGAAVFAVVLPTACSDESQQPEPFVGEAITGANEPTETGYWNRGGDDPVRGVGVSEWSDGSITVFVNVAEFLRREPLESEMRTSVSRAIRSVPGVESFYEEDRELWVISGTPDGQQLLDAVGEAVDGIAAEAEAEVYRP